MNTPQTLKTLIEANGGDARVVSIIFNNAYVKSFTETDPFDFETHVDETTEYFNFIERDTTGIKYKVVKPVEYVEAVIFVTKDEDIKHIDRRYIRG